MSIWNWWICIPLSYCCHLRLNCGSVSGRDSKQPLTAISLAQPPAAFGKASTVPERHKSKSSNSSHLLLLLLRQDVEAGAKNFMILYVMANWLTIRNTTGTVVSFLFNSPDGHGLCRIDSHNAAYNRSKILLRLLSNSTVKISFDDSYDVYTLTLLQSIGNL